MAESIRELGLENYLKMTTEAHDGYDYTALIKYIERGWGPVALSRLFMVSKNTMLKWLVIHKEEQLVKK